MTQSGRSHFAPFPLISLKADNVTNDIARLHELLNQSMELLDEAATLVEPSKVEPKKQSLKLIGLAIGQILNVRKFVYDTEPSLKED